MTGALSPLLALVATVLALGLVAGRARGGPGPAWLTAGRRVPVPPALLAAARPARAERVLGAAGLAGVASPDDLARARLGAVALAGAAGALLAPVWSGAVVLAPLAAGLAAFAPERALARRAAARRRRMTRALPEVLDLLAICVEGGMALDPALAVATEHARGPLGDELAAARADIALGMPRRDAYAALAERCGVPEVAVAVGALVQAEELGAPLSPALAAQAGATREAARRAALDRAAKAGPRIQLVVATILVPAALVLIVGAFAIELAGQVGAVIDAP